jgi:hypothetical protein
MQYRTEVMLKMSKHDLINHIKDLYSENSSLYSEKEEYKEEAQESKRKERKLSEQLNNVMATESASMNQKTYLDGQLSTLLAMINAGKSEEERIYLDRPFNI